MAFSESQTLKKLENLDFHKAFSEHNKDFNKIVEFLEEFYHDYKNSAKIIQLLNSWLYFYRSINESYGISGVKEFSQSKFSCPIRFSYYHEYGVDIHYKQDGYKNKTLFKIFNGFLRKALLPGADVKSLYSKCSWRFAKFVLVNIPSRVQNSRKIELVNKISDFFSDYFINNMDEITFYLEATLPSIFYEDVVSVSERAELIVECSPWTLLEFSGYERIFLLDRYINVIGLQHGGGYFAFEDEYSTLFEQNISDQFIGWGLSDCRNQRQHRYPHGSQISNTPLVPKRIIWVEHARRPIFNYFIWSLNVRQAYNQNVIDYIHTELTNVGRKFYSRPYPSNFRSSQYDGLRGIELDNTNVRGEGILTNGDIVIFDELGSSLIFHCIELQIPFILVLSRDDVFLFKKKQRKWFDIVRDCELAFYDDEKGKMCKKINEIFQKPFGLPQALRNFHRSIFIDI